MSANNELFRAVGRAAQHRASDGLALTDAEAEQCGRDGLRAICKVHEDSFCHDDCGFCTSWGTCCRAWDYDGKPGPDCPLSEGD